MPTLQWSEALDLDLPLMDDTHREFVDLLARAEAADDASVTELWAELVDHTTDHFGREDHWMSATAFASGNCHAVQHKVVLQVLQEGLRLAREGQLAPVRQMIRELAVWFPHHAQTMDAALALHLRRVGYDPVTGIVHSPDALPESLIHGCGGACSSDDEQATEGAVAA